MPRSACQAWQDWGSPALWLRGVKLPPGQRPSSFPHHGSPCTHAALAGAELELLAAGCSGQQAEGRA